jgi:putative FmdB family regulatory protein
VEMPIYEYICENCKEELEVIQKISDEPLTECPSCKNKSLKKKTSMSAFHLKGGGWYKDGYGNSNSNGSTNSSSNGNSKAKTDSSQKKDSSTKAANSETKPAKPVNTTPKSKAS